MLIKNTSYWFKWNDWRAEFYIQRLFFGVETFFSGRQYISLGINIKPREFSIELNLLQICVYLGYERRC